MLNLKEDIKPISYIKTNAADMMKYVTDVKNPIIITQNGEAKTCFNRYRIISRYKKCI